MKKLSIALLCLILIIAGGFGILYKVDMQRMEKGEPVIFSTWGNEYAPEEDYPLDDEIYMYADKNTITDKGMKLVVINNSDRDIVFGEPFIVEKVENGNWKQLKYIFEDGRGWNDMAYGVYANGEAEFKIYWADIYGELEKGTYRISKYYFYDEPDEMPEMNPLYFGFTIE